MMKRLVWLLAGTVIGLGLVAGGFYLRQQLTNAARPALHGLELDVPQPASDFTLWDGARQPVRLSDFRGRWVLLYFGYTACPDVCPATLADVASAVQTLGERAGEVQVLFVTIDPERDPPEQAARYARAFDPSFIGLSGSLDEITTAATPFGIYFEKDTTSATAAGYLMTHTSTVTAIDRQGNVRLVWPFGVTRDEMAEDLRYLVTQ